MKTPTQLVYAEPRAQVAGVSLPQREPKRVQDHAAFGNTYESWENLLVARTPVVLVRIPPALLEAARVALNASDATDSDLVRAGLANLAGLPPSTAYMKRGPRRNTE